GSVAWQFDSVGFIALDVGDGDPEEVALAAIDAGAEDVRTEDNRVEVYTAPTELIKVRRALDGAGLTVATAELSMLPKNTITLDDKSATQILRLLDILEDLDDVQKVFSNADFPDSVLMEYAAAQ
ncbi:MAG: YebC/PmpR family DNA-binding transcriptional regulator, partial [Dehalococcoidia bacterium]